MTFIVIVKKLSNYLLKPVIEVTIKNGLFSVTTKALVDTGSAKAYWVDSTPLKKECIKRHVDNNGSASGLGIGTQNGCSVNIIDVNIYDGAFGININDIPITSATVNTRKLFSLVLPYTLFLGMKITYDLVDVNNGKFVIETNDNQVNYKAITDNKEVIVGSCIDTSDIKPLRSNVFS